jgi:multiple sugar transport system permease protein
MIEGAIWRRWVFFRIPLAIFLIFLLFPFYWMIITTFRPDGELYRPWRAANYTPFWTWNPTTAHLKYLFGETTFLLWMWNTMFIAVVATAISLVCGVLAGYALSRLNFRLAGLLGTAIFVTYLVPQTLLFIPLSEIIRNYNLGDTPWSLILTYPTFLIPFCTWLMMGYFKAIPKELEECARIDGATRWQAMLYIILPVAVPGILSAGIFAFTLSWNEFLLPLLFNNKHELWTLPVGLQTLIYGDVFMWGEIMIGAFLMSIPVLILYTVSQRFVVTGLTAGAVKG